MVWPSVMQVILSEILTTEYAISTPFLAFLGRVPVTVYAVLDNTVVLQVIGEDDRRVVRHDLINVDPEKLRARPSPLVDQLHKSRLKGRMNSRRSNERTQFGIDDEINEQNWSEYGSLEELASAPTEDSEETVNRSM